ncbi:hypothetical protein CDL15_Pgr013679 [Punica granatum]|uniref:F-box protein At4g35930 n=1 Tax=Punica granatum TaxID=22663 RepID=A0A218W2Z0_PUNGR|nr:hypothetical protein CDL15_Pgr013679 [Punica granatum]
MGKVLPPERDSKRLRQKRRSRGSGNKYLKPGALAQLRYSKPLSTRSCTDLGKKRVAVLDAKKGEENLVIEDKPLDSTPLMLSPVSLVKQSNVLQEGAEKGLDHAVIESTPIDRSPVFSSPINYSKQNNLLRTPKTPRFDDCDTESRLEALPMDLLVLIARQFHFNYTTPDRSRQEMLRMITPRPTDHWPFKRGEGKGTPLRSPLAPKAPRQGPRPPSRIKISEMRQIAAVLFQEKSTFPSRCIVPSVLSKPLCKSLASNRALFYEDELCQAVAQNKLR